VTIVNDVYELNLATAGKLKLRATARLAEGGADAVFEACVLLHEAARAERRAVDALPRCPPSTRLAASIEECWCLIEGADPARAGRAWGRVLEDLRHVDRATGEAMLSRIHPRHEESQRAFHKVIASCTHLTRVGASGSLVPPTKDGQLATHRDVQRALAAFPGAVGFWWASYRLLEAMGELQKSWAALQRARLLDPENRRFEAMSLFLAVHALPEMEADEYLGRVRSSFDGAGAEICLMYALAELHLAEKGSRAKERRTRALDASNAGLTQATTDGLRRNLKATQLLSQDLLAGRKPTLDILYRAGLGESAAAASSSRNVAELVTQLASRSVAPNEPIPQAA